MKTIKIIDLFIKIANDEDVPKKIKYRNWLYEFEKDCNDYLCQYDSLLYSDNDDVKKFLNDAVEIIEEKKIPEKLDSFSFKKETDDLTFEECEVENYLSNVTDKINEILNYLESKGE